MLTSHDKDILFQMIDSMILKVRMEKSVSLFQRIRTISYLRELKRKLGSVSNKGREI